MTQRTCISCGENILLRQRLCNHCGASQDGRDNLKPHKEFGNTVPPLRRHDAQHDTSKLQGKSIGSSDKKSKGYIFSLSSIRLGLFPSLLLGLLIAVGFLFITEEAKLQSDVLVSGEVDQDGYVSVPLSHNGGVLMVESLVNDSSRVEFTVDSGAGDMSIPEEIMKELKIKGVVGDADFTGTGRYILADGRVVEAAQYNIKRITVGGVTALDVQSSVSPENSPPLLGQTFFKKFKSWRIDNARNRLYLEVRK